MHANAPIAAGRRPSLASAAFAMGVAVVSVALWVGGGAITDALYLPAGLVGLVAAILGVRARRAADGDGASPRLALAAVVVGGLQALAMAGFAIVYLGSRLV